MATDSGAAMTFTGTIATSDRHSQSLIIMEMVQEDVGI